ncbi:unnamed protein product [Boreogadus saida]
MPTQERVGDSLISAFMGAGITKLGDLLDHENGRWKLALEVSAQTGLRSLRLVADLLGRLRVSLPNSLSAAENSVVAGTPEQRTVCRDPNEPSATSPFPTHLGQGMADTGESGRSAGNVWRDTDKQNQNKIKWLSSSLALLGAA